MSWKGALCRTVHCVTVQSFVNLQPGFVNLYRAHINGAAVHASPHQPLLIRSMCVASSHAGPQLVQMFIGDGAKMVRDAFALAKEKQPAIIFIDEIDAIGTKRFDSELSGDREVQRTMLELLNQLDGFTSNDNVKVRAVLRRGLSSKTCTASIAVGDSCVATVACWLGSVSSWLQGVVIELYLQFDDPSGSK